MPERNRNLPASSGATMPSLGGEQSLNRYLTEIKKFPVLTAEQEYMLAKRYAEHQDPEAAAQLVTSHLRLVAKIAMGYRGYGLPVSELISEGNIGLMQGVKKFEPDRGFRLATYAMWWIKASMQEFILRSWSLVKMGTTAAQKFLADSKVKAELNNNNFQVGQIDLSVPGRQMIARNYRGLEVYRYDAQYTNESGTATNYIPAGVAVLASRASRHLRFLYGPINDLKAGYFPTKFFSKQYETEDPSMRRLLVGSSPLPLVGHAQSIVYATVA